MPHTFVRRERKHRRLAKQHDPAAKAAEISEDVNRAIIVPAEAVARNARREQLKADLAKDQGKVSSKKRKRLDHYIETKLKKEDKPQAG